VDREIQQLRREMREGGQLRAGDWLGDGRYLLLEPIGRGGFSIVWRAHDSELQRDVAIKVLHAELAGDSVRRERFFRGARRMVDLAGDGVVRVLDPHGEDGG
jgi:serine/threonine protein kinase